MAETNFKWLPFFVLMLVTLFNASSCQFQNHRSLGNDGRITLTKSDVVTAQQAGDTRPWWSFSTSVGRRIRFHFRSNFYFWIQIGDGLSYEENTRFVYFGSNHQPSDVVSISNAAWLRSTWGEHLTYTHRTGFMLEVDITSTPVEAPRLLEEGSELSIKTPNYPNTYQTNAFRLWDIRVPEGLSVSVNVVRFNTQQNYDSLFFGDGVDKFSIGGDFCNNWTRFSGAVEPESLEAELTPKASSFKIIFSSHYNAPVTGFYIRMHAFRPQNVHASVNTTRYYSVPEKSSLVVSTEMDESMNSMMIVPTTSEWTSLFVNTSLNHRISISFEQLCLKDHSEILEIGDGSHIDHDTRLAIFSGSTLPSDVISVSNAAWIRIHFPDRNRLLHLRMIITSMDFTDVKSLEENVDFSINTPNYPNNYPNNTFQLWDIRVPGGLSVLFNVERFNTQQNADYLFFGDGVDKFSIGGDFCNKWKRFSGVHEPDSLEAELTPNASSFKVIFSSNGGTQSTGFSIRMRAFRPQKLQTSLNTARYYSLPEKSSLVISTKMEESMNSTMTVGTSISEWTSLIFNTSLNHRINISFEQLCFKDHAEILEIGDGSHIDDDTRLARFTGSSLPSDVISVSNAAWMKIYFPSRSRLLHLRVIITSMDFTEEVLTVGRQLFLSSPRIGDGYPNNAYNMWLLRAPETSVIGIQFFHFDMESDADVLHIGEDAESFAVSSPRWMHLSGSYGEVEEISYSSSLTLIFTSDGEGTASGFLIGFTAEERVSSANTTFESDSDASNLTTLSSSNQGASTSSIDPSSIDPLTSNGEFDGNIISHGSNACTTSSAEYATNNVGLTTRIMLGVLSVTTFALSCALLIFIRWAYLKRRSHLRDMNQRVGNPKITDHPDGDFDKATYTPMFEGLSPANEASISLKSNPEPVREFDDDEYIFPLKQDGELVKMAQKSSKEPVNLATCTILEGYNRSPDTPDDPEHHIYEAPNEMETRA